MTRTAELRAIYLDRGSRAYLGEAVTMAEHGLQAAYFAESAGAPSALVVAALLHDIGHLIDGASGDAATWTADAGHEHSGASWLARRFGAAVTEPVRLHVAAKRYLCATDPAYLRQLSPASVATLRLQGGAMSATEVRAFEAQAGWRDAVLLRHCDDQGKIAGLQTPGLDYYLGLSERLGTQ